MDNKLNIGSIKLPTTSATKGFGFIGKRGSGKSYGAAVFAEELYDTSIPFVVFDPIDVWWGLKVDANGKDKGLPIVVFGKEHADIQLDRSMGKRIAEAVVRENISCVISTFGLNKTEMREIIADFSERLLQLNNTPRQVIIEEAHEFVPQRVMGAGARCFSAVEALLVMGRNRGIGVTLLNQRMATLNKDLLTQIDVLVAFRSVGPQDRKAFQDWVEVHNDENDSNFDEFMKSVPSLPTGEAWVWSPEFLEIFEKVKFRKRRTFHPDREKLGMTFKMPEIKQGDIQSFIDSFAKKPEVPKQEKNRYSPPIVQKNVQVDPHTVEKAVSKAIEKRDKEWMQVVQAWKVYAEARKRDYKRAVSKLQNLALSYGIVFVFPVDPPERPESHASTHLIVDKEKLSRPLDHLTDTRMGVSNEGITRPEQKILDAVAWMNTIGVARPNNSVVAFLSGYTNPQSSGYKGPRASLIVKGLIVYPTPGELELTEDGRALANHSDGPQDESQLQQMILDRLTGPQQAILAPLLQQGLMMDNSDLAIAAGYSNPQSSGYKGPRSELRAYGLIEYVSGKVKAADILFL